MDPLSGSKSGRTLGPEEEREGPVGVSGWEGRRRLWGGSVGRVNRTGSLGEKRVERRRRDPRSHPSSQEGQCD